MPHSHGCGKGHRAIMLRSRTGGQQPHATLILTRLLLGAATSPVGSDRPATACCQHGVRPRPCATFPWPPGWHGSCLEKTRHSLRYHRLCLPVWGPRGAKGLCVVPATTRAHKPDTASGLRRMQIFRQHPHSDGQRQTPWAAGARGEGDERSGGVITQCGSIECPGQPPGATQAQRPVPILNPLPHAVASVPARCRAF